MELKKSINCIVDEIKNYLEKKDKKIEQFKQEFIEKIDKIINNEDKKINLIFFGDASSGKTSSINLLLQYFSESHNRNNIFENNVISNDSRNEEEEIFSLITAEAENTYYFTFIEKSSSDHYEVIFDVKDENERNIINESKIFEFTIDEKNPIKFDFPNSNEGKKQLNEFIKKIDDISMKFLEIIRKNEMSNENSAKIQPSIKIIKVPNFPEEYRIVDTPGISMKKIANNFLDIFDECNNQIIIIFVQDIMSSVTYDRDSEIFERTNIEHGKPFVYSFHTKGISFINRFYSIEKINKQKEKENKTNLSKYCEINSLYFDRIKDYKNKNIYFRKIIPIIDNDYDNENIKKNLDVFIDDVKSIKKENYNFIKVKNKILKIRRIIMNFNDKISKKNLLSEKEKDYLKQGKEKSIKNFENVLNEYFNKFDTFENFKNYFADQIFRLEEIFTKNQNSIQNYWNRSNYINKHLELVFNDFQNIIIEELSFRLKVNIQNFYDSIEIPILKKINLRLHFEKETIYENSFKFKSDSVFFLKSLGNYFIRNFFNNYNSEKDEVCKRLIDWLINSKVKYIKKFNEEYENELKKLVEDISQKKEIVEISEELFKITDKIKEIKPMNKDLMFKEEEYLDLIENEDLKKFIKKALNYNESEVLE